MGHPAWKECRRGEECPVCGATSWCTRTRDGKTVLCHETPSDRPSGDGWVHHLDGRERSKDEPEYKDCWPEVLDAAARISPARRRALDRELGLPDGTSARMSYVGVGRDGGGEYALFPMWDGGGSLCGYSRRYRDGKKSWGRNGLFLPAHDPGGPMVLVVEGASDVLAAAAMGVYAVGRPSNTGGVEQLAELLRTDRRVVVIVGENDEKADGRIPGWTGMIAVRDQLGPRLRPTRVLARPMLDGVKDLREWAIQNRFDGGRLTNLIG